jgi:hypothetical protein
MAHYTIHNKGVNWRREELVAAGTISPGMLLEVLAAGTIQAHSLEGGRSERLVAIEDVFQGKGVDTNYSAADQVFVAVVEPGSVWNLLMAAGEDGAPGAAVISAGDGTVKCVDNASSAGLIAQVIGYIDESEAAFTTLAANTLKAIRIA